MVRLAACRLNGDSPGCSHLPHCLLQPPTLTLPHSPTLPSPACGGGLAMGGGGKGGGKCGCGFMVLLRAMLLGLTIRDVVLIDRLSLAFRPGLCVLTGETGAGKSLLLDALGLALGRRP